MTFSDLTLAQILDDLTSRFVINVPDEELASIQRVIFQVEQAHWFYTDFIREENHHLPQFSLKTFTLLMFKHCPLLQHWVSEHDRAFGQFMEYKTTVPVCGAIILNKSLDSVLKLTKVLLVRGWKASAGWGFPKGKINKNESEILCAIREVYEETGFDCSPFMRKNEYIERTFSGQRQRLYVITGISDDQHFETQTRREIGVFLLMQDIKWHALRTIPGYAKNEVDGHATANKKHKFYLVSPFMSQVRRWVKRFQKARKQGTIRNNADLKVVMDTEEATESDHITDSQVEYTTAREDEYVVTHTDATHLETSIKQMLGMGKTEELPPAIPLPQFRKSPSPEDSKLMAHAQERAALLSILQGHNQVESPKPIRILKRPAQLKSEEQNASRSNVASAENVRATEDAQSTQQAMLEILTGRRSSSNKPTSAKPLSPLHKTSAVRSPSVKSSSLKSPFPTNKPIQILQRKKSSNATELENVESRKVPASLKTVDESTNLLELLMNRDFDDNLSESTHRPEQQNLLDLLVKGPSMSKSQSHASPPVDERKRIPSPRLPEVQTAAKSAKNQLLDLLVHGNANGHEMKRSPSAANVQKSNDQELLNLLRNGTQKAKIPSISKPAVQQNASLVETKSVETGARDANTDRSKALLDVLLRAKSSVPKSQSPVSTSPHLYAGTGELDSSNKQPDVHSASATRNEERQPSNSQSRTRRETKGKSSKKGRVSPVTEEERSALLQEILAGEQSKKAMKPPKPPQWNADNTQKDRVQDEHRTNARAQETLLAILTGPRTSPSNEKQDEVEQSASNRKVRAPPSAASSISLLDVLDTQPTSPSVVTMFQRPLKTIDQDSDKSKLLNLLLHGNK